MFFTNSYSFNTIVKNYLLKSIILTQEKTYSDLPLSNISILLTDNKNYLSYKIPLLQQLRINDQEDNSIFLQEINQVFSNNYSQWNLAIDVNKNGWLEIKISDRILNQWLNEVSKIEKIEILNKNENQDKKKKEEKIKFSYYYTHARCSSLLKSAHEQNLIELSNLEFQFNQWNLAKPELINYQYLNLYDSYEGELIKELIMIVDKIENQKINYLTSLDSLTNKILNIEKYCSIWGEVLKKNPNISIARLGLIAIALKYYQIMIQAQFQQQLPSEL